MQTHKGFVQVLGALAMLAALVGTAGGTALAGTDPTNLAPLAARIPAVAPASPPGIQFVTVATASNSAGDFTDIDHPLTNNNPNAIIFVTPNWNPGGVGGVYNNHPLGVWYNGTTKKWSIFNQDHAAIPPGAAFNVFIPAPGTNVFVHQATVANSTSDYTDIDNPLTNNNPNAIVFVTPNWNAGGVGGVYNNHAIGAWYNASTSKWSIFNQDLTAIPNGAAFNVYVAAAGPGAFVHKATVANSASDYTDIDNPLTTYNANAIVFVTPNWNPGGSGGVYNNHPIGVWFNGNTAKWSVFNQDLAAMPNGAAFNVLVLPPVGDALVHYANGSNSALDYTNIDDPLTNNNPNAIIFVTPNWNPGGGNNGVYNNHPIGVWYNATTKNWSIFNQDLAPIPNGAAFNVLLPNPDASVHIHMATPANSAGDYTDIDYPLTNNNPNAIIFVTPNWNPGGVGGVYNNHPIGVWYNATTKKWSIFNQDLAPIPNGAAFNVFIPVPGTYVFVHKATVANSAFDYTDINNPLANGNPPALVWVTPNWNPGAVGGVYDTNPVGVWYHATVARWSIFNQDGTSAIPNGAAFNVCVAPPQKLFLPMLLR